MPGIGITPMAGMLSHLVAAGSGLEIMLLHADVDEGSFALRRQVVSDVLALRNASIHLWYEKGTGSNEPVDGVHSGMMDLSHVTLPDNAWYYLCGPIPFLQAVRSALIERGVHPATSSTRCSARTCGKQISTSTSCVGNVTRPHRSLRLVARRGSRPVDEGARGRDLRSAGITAQRYRRCFWRT